MTTLVPTGLFVSSTWLYPARFSSSARCSSISRRRETSLTKYLVTDKELFQLVADKFDMRHSSTDAFGDMRSSRPEHFTVRSGSRPVTEYPRSGIAFSPEASRSPSPYAKNPLGDH